MLVFLLAFSGCAGAKRDDVALAPAPTTKEIGDATRLVEALEAGDHDRLRRELESGAGVDAMNPHGLTPLSIAAYLGDVEGARILLLSGANVSRRSDWGLTPLHHACVNGHADMVVFLLVVLHVVQ